MQEQVRATYEADVFRLRSSRATDRRTFLKVSGATAAALGIAACNDSTGPRGVKSVVLDFSMDLGVMNYAYALEQLEAAFYTRATASFYAGATDNERAILTDIRDHEIAHREFFQAKIRDLGADPIGELLLDFGSVNFGSRESVLTTAQTFEDLGVRAYNGAARFISSVNPLMAAGEIVSVEARHAATLRDLLQPGTAFFAPNAFDDPLPPSQVLPMLSPFVKTQITLQNAA